MRLIVAVKVTVLAVVLGLSVGGCESTGSESYLDREFRAAPKAYTNVFALMKTYQKQTEAPGQSDGVRVIRYYEKNQRYAGYSNKASTWFTLVSEDELKARLAKRIKQHSTGAAANPDGPDGIVGPVRIADGIGYYYKDGSCYFISVFKRVSPWTGYDNDNSDPDFIGFFHICGGLTVTPKEFIEKIGLADDDAEARYLKLISQQTNLAPPGNRG